jgi:tRNA threonylcarbamoyladenosine biosynthesis protein TsaE
VHADLYRVGSLAEVEDLDLEADAADGVLVVEWGDAAEQRFPDDHLVVRIEVGDDGTRTIRMEPHGSWTDRPLEEAAG